MVEMALALGVVAVGIVSILALFPIGLNASRDAMADSFAADAAEQMIHQMEYMLQTNWTTYLPGIPGSKPPTGTFVGDPVPNTNGTIFQNAISGTTDGRYRVIRFVDRSITVPPVYDANTDVLDFEAILLIWKSNVSIPGPSGPVPVADSVAVALNLEVSWPAQLPYEQRQISYYTKEVFKR